MGLKGADVRVFGVGGAGANAVRRMAHDGIAGAMLIAANTDTQSLADHPADVRIALGRHTDALASALTRSSRGRQVDPRDRRSAARGLGAGGNPCVGLSAAEESMPAIARALSGADLVFIAAGLGGGTGTGAAPVVARVARDQGALAIGVVTLPFAFEGARRGRMALEGLEALRAEVDSLLVVPNDRLLELPGPDTTAIAAFSRADAVLADGVRGIGDLVMRPGLINLDFADVRAVLGDGGRAVMGLGVGRGADRAIRAVEAASRSPLLDDASIEGARGVLLSFTVDPRIGLGRIHEAAARIQAEVDDDAEILFGVAVDPTLDDEVRVTLVAAGLDRVDHEEPAVEEPEPAHVLADARRKNALVFLSR
jgi:cell division protein FtsZ